MALDSVINGGSGTAGKVNVDSTFNLQTNLPLTTAAGVAVGGGPANAGFVSLQSEVDAGAVSGARAVRQLTSSVFNRLSVGEDTVLFSDYMNAPAQNTGIWKSNTNLFTFAFNNGGYLNLNASAITTTAAAQIWQSCKSFTQFGGTPLMLEFSEYRTSAPPANTRLDVGFFLAPVASTPFAPTDGVYFKFDSSGISGVLNYNGVESTQLLLSAANMVLNDNTTYRIVINHYRVEFWGASATSNPRILLGMFPVPAANGPAFASLNVPIGVRYVHTGVAGSAYQPKYANFVVLSQDTQTNIPGPQLQNVSGFYPYQGGNGDTMGTTALLTNNLAAGAGAAMTNTTAALGSGLGGQFAALPTLTVGTDGIVCSFQNNASAVNQTGATVVITGVRIQGAVTTILAGGPVLYEYSLAVGHTAVSMATAEAAAAKAPRRIALGFENFVVTAPVGTIGAGVYVPFPSGVPVNQGEFIAICAKNLGVVTTTGVITFAVTFEGYQI
jgi:hypothetical protein